MEVGLPGRWRASGSSARSTPGRVGERAWRRGHVCCYGSDGDVAAAPSARARHQKDPRRLSPRRAARPPRRRAQRRDPLCRRLCPPARTRQRLPRWPRTARAGTSSHTRLGLATQLARRQLLGEKGLPRMEGTPPRQLKLVARLCERS